MRKDQREELRRLEEALLEQERPAPETEEADRWLEDFYTEPVQGYRAYNTDTADVDMDAYSEDVHAGRRGGCLVWLMVMLTVLLCALVGFLLWKQGVLPWM